MVKSHGSARSVEIRHAIFQCEQFKEEKINEKIEEFIAAEQKAQAKEKKRKKIKPGLPEILQTEQEANSRGTGNAEDHHRKNSGKKYGCHYRKKLPLWMIWEWILWIFFQILIDLEETFDVRIDRRKPRRSLLSAMQWRLFAG